MGEQSSSTADDLKSKLTKLEIQDNENQVDFEEVLEVNFGIVKSRNGDETNLKLTIPLMAKHREFNLEKLPKVRKYFVDYLYSKGVIWSKKEQEVIDVGILCAYLGLCDPSLDMEDPLVKLCASFCIPAYYTDDLLDQGFMGDDASRERSQEVTQFLTSIFSQLIKEKDREEVEGLSASIPALQPGVYLFQLAKELKQSLYGDKRLLSDRAITCMKDAGLSQYIMGNAVFRNSLSTAGYTYFRRYNVAVYIPLHVMCAMQNRTLKAEIENNVIFKIMEDIYCQFSGILNDLVGIVKDVEEEETANYILRDMHDLGIPLETAYKNRTREMCTLLRDYCILARKLMDLYPDDDDLICYIESMRKVWTNASFFYKACPNRYKLHGAVFNLREPNPGEFGI